MNAKAAPDNVRTYKIILWCLFALYFLALTAIILFKYGGMTNVGGLNLVPFDWMKPHASSSAAFKNVFGNFALFIPLGLFLPLLFPKLGPVKTTLAGLLLSLAYEVIQYTTSIGVADVDDLILNTCGAAFGALLYWLATGRAKSPRQRFRAGFLTIVLSSVICAAALLFY